MSKVVESVLGVHDILVRNRVKAAAEYYRDYRDPIIGAQDPEMIAMAKVEVYLVEMAAGLIVAAGVALKKSEVLRSVVKGVGIGIAGGFVGSGIKRYFDDMRKFE